MRLFVVNQRMRLRDSAAAVLALVALVVAGCVSAGSPSASPTGSSEPSPSPVASVPPPRATAGLMPSAAPTPSPTPTQRADLPCPTLPVDLATLIALDQQPGTLSLAWNQEFGTFSERGAACLNDQPVTFIAFVAGPEGLGGTVTYVIEPLWLSSRAFFLQPTADMNPDSGDGAGPFYRVALLPLLDVPEHALDSRWVRITGHFHDWAARTCVADGGSTPTPAEVLAICQASFVVTAIATTSAP